MTRQPHLRDSRDDAREVLRIAAGPDAPDARRLVEALPQIMAEAGRRREIERGQPETSALIPIARRAIPRLAAVAAAVVIAAVLFAFRDASSAQEARADLERAILTGASGDAPPNSLLEALTTSGKSDG